MVSQTRNSRLIWNDKQILLMPSKLPPKAYSRPLDRAFYGVILKLEDKAFQKVITEQEVGDLIRMYSEIISYYDSQNDPIKFYFMEKIQVFLERKYMYEQFKSTPKKKNVIKPEKPKKLELRSASVSSNDTGSRESDGEAKDIFIAKPFTPRQKQMSPVQERKISISTLKKSRQKKMSLMIEINKVQQEEQPVQYNDLIGNYEENVAKTDENIKQQLQDQSDTLQARIENRRKNRSKQVQSLAVRPLDAVEEVENDNQIQ